MLHFILISLILEPVFGKSPHFPSLFYLRIACGSVVNSENVITLTNIEIDFLNQDDITLKNVDSNDICFLVSLFDDMLLVATYL